ncbi:methyl-CpG-binding domain protein 1 isoform X3 [Onychomys torridus]|uniref:methyl-CpG-binding domain protein 1 isoform X3 n=1 Tax=Onychomys torridus TaxID=38674 RepID=UPI00167F7ABF|nr:methyl-CpG-binding domain protein 1 isoform X3 [Onychomys torridus]
MAEDWQDCPALGPGWKRREAFRKSGASCGRSDIYYQSPTGEKIRSKVELTRYLGPACDLTLFDFRQGILCYPVPKTHPLPAPSKKKKKPSKPAKAKKCQVGPQKSEVRKETPRNEQKAGARAGAASGTAPGPAPAPAPASLPALGCCENCGIHLSWDGIKRQRLKALCKDCRAQRIAFNREQRMFRRVGCGECAACLIKEDCGACSICRLRLPHDVASELFCKCERRRCLRIVEKSRGCGVCRGCQTQEDCGRCRVCLRPARPGLKRQWRCLQRRCFWHFAHRFRGHPQGCHQCPPQVVVSPTGKRDRRKSSSKAAARHHSRAQPLPPLPASQHPEPTELQPYTNHRQNRKCGACAACLRRMDCGHCDFCCDKPKFGGSNQKRQKCRWRQCLQFAMKRLLPSTGSGSEERARLPPCHPCRKRPGSPRRPHLSSPSKAPLAVLTTPAGPAQASAKQQAGRGFVLSPPDTDFVFLQEGASSPVQVPGPAAASSEAPLQEDQCCAQSWGVAMPQVKQEKTDAPEEWTAGTAFLTSSTLQPGYPSKAVDSDLPPVKQEPPGPEEGIEGNREDYVSESAPEEEAGGVGTPVITEIFSLGGTRLRDAAAWLPSLKVSSRPGLVEKTIGVDSKAGAGHPWAEPVPGVTPVVQRSRFHSSEDGGTD